MSKGKSNKPKALYYAVLDYQQSSLRMLEDNFELTKIYSPCDDDPELLLNMELIFAPLGYRTGREKIDKCPNLKVIASNTTGHPHIDVEYARIQNIKVVTLKGEETFLLDVTPTAELTWGLIIALTRNIIPAHQSVMKGQWNRRPFAGLSMLSNMRLGIVGLGRLGSMVAKYAIATGMEVCFFDPYVVYSSPDVSRCQTLEELVSQSDIVTVHIPHENKTTGIFDKKLFSLFKVGSYFVNTSRGELVDQAALLEVLIQGKLSGVAMDVFENEFNPQFNIAQHSLWDYAQSKTNLILTPHIGGSTVDAWKMTEQMTIRRVLEALESE